MHLFLFKLTKTSKIILTPSGLKVKALPFVAEKEKNIINVIKGTVTPYFFKNAGIIAPSCHVCQGSVKP